jgi:uncharacterized protein YlxW (UPF0749 family)
MIKDGNMTILGLVASTTGAVITGGLFKTLLDRVSLTKMDQYSTLVMLVEQLQRNVNENNDKIRELEKEVNEWRDKYYKELDEKNKLSNEVRQLRLELQKFNKNQNS